MSRAESSLDTETRENLNRIPNNLYDKWGRDGLWSPFDGRYQDKTVVRDGDDAIKAFEKYTEYFEHVLNSWDSTSDTVVLVPCGSSKPIGSSTLHQKKVQAIRDGGFTEADIVVVSEPCTVVPPDYRLSMPAANYDFPPQYTVREDYPKVFDVFVNRLAKWIDEMDYDLVVPYLISGHQNKFDAAVEQIDTSPEIIEIPSASYNPDSESYSGDRFKKQREITWKVKAVRKYKLGDNVSLPDIVDDFFRDRF